MTGKSAFNLVALLRSAGLPAPILRCDVGEVIFSADDAADTVMYVVKGTVKLSVVSRRGREAVVAIVRAGDFFGEACLADQRTRERTATAMSPTAVVTIDRTDMARMLRTNRAIFDRFMQHLLRRSLRAQDDLVDQLVSSCEQRLVRALLLLSRSGKYRKRAKKVLPTVSQSTLAGIVGSTRSRVNYFMNRFARLGLLDTSGGLTVKRALRRYSQDTTHAR